MNQYSIFDDCFVDSFAGGGGASTGIEMATGHPVDIAINHNEAAIMMHRRNCAWFDRGNGHNVEDDCNLAYKGVDEHKSYKPIKRPFQSWGYVEELKGESE